MISAGIIIDDALFLEQVPISVHGDGLKETDGARRLRAMKEEYLQRDLVPHPSKTFEAESQAEFWGASVCGTSGLVRAAPRRLVPLIDITISTLTLGFATVALLQTLAGAWVSVLQFRRRMLCLLDEIYVAQHGRLQTDVVRLSRSLQDELWLLVCLGPLAVTDLRAQTEDTFFLTDASEEVKASVSSKVPLAFARELHRHSLVRGTWTRLLSPWKVWLQQHFQLEEEDALPDGVPLVSHPLWLILCESFAISGFSSEDGSRTKAHQFAGVRKHLRVGGKTITPASGCSIHFRIRQPDSSCCDLERTIELSALELLAAA